MMQPDQMEIITALEHRIAYLEAALEEIAHHYIDSEFASREKRGMAQRALTSH
jgi:hypothetical protein